MDDYLFAVGMIGIFLAAATVSVVIGHACGQRRRQKMNYETQRQAQAQRDNQ